MRRSAVRRRTTTRDARSQPHRARGGTRGRPGGSSQAEIEEREERQEPVLVAVQEPDLEAPEPVSSVQEWLREKRVRVLNVAGPREESAPGIYRASRLYLLQVLEAR